MQVITFWRAIPDVCNNIGEGPALQVLHDDPQLILHQVAVVHLHDVRVVVVTHYDNLNINEKIWICDHGATKHLKLY